MEPWGKNELMRIYGPSGEQEETVSDTLNETEALRELLQRELQGVQQERDEARRVERVRTHDLLAAGNVLKRAERDRDEAEKRLRQQRDDAINGRDDLPMSHVILAQLQKVERERDEARQALWDCAVIAGMDADGNTTPRSLGYPSVEELAKQQVKQLREDYDSE